MKQVIAFRCDAGREDGLGHLSRCLVIAEALSTRGLSPLFITSSGDGMIGAQRIRQSGFSVMETVTRPGSPGDTAYVRTIRPNDGRGTLLVDSRRAGGAYIGELAKDWQVVVIDDDGQTDIPAHYVINNRIDATPELYGSTAADRRLLLGPRYNTVAPQYFRDVPLDRPPRTLLVTFGGEDPGNCTRWLLDFVLAPRPEIQIIVIVGPAHPDPHSVAEVCEHRSDVRLVDSPRSLIEFIAEADVAVGAAGTTCYELIAARVPIMVFEIEPHQRALAQSLVAKGACFSLGEGGRDSAPARAVLGNLLDQLEARSAMRAAQAALLPKPGVDEIVAAIFGR